MVRLLRVALAVAMLGFGSGVAQAGGYGGYLEGEFSFSGINDHGVDRGFEAQMGGLGLIYDGNIAVDELLNYRLGFGYRLGSRDLDDGGTETVNGLTLDQTLGLGFLRNSLVRVWAGPSLRLNFDWYGNAGDVDIMDVSIGVGPRFGVNLHVTDRISLTSSVAYHYMYLSENLESQGLNQTIDGPQHMVGLNLGILWRSEDDIWGE